mmetsp:Transcript_14072/g.40127  ORF Transcript_14072/g.40127 Transcript_14072/m.40127 type:complete len:972 (-) Transcript_14072:797-3712(-)
MWRHCHHPTTIAILCSMVALESLVCSLRTTDSVRHPRWRQLQILDEDDSDRCNEALINSDMDSDLFVSDDEYTRFVNILGNSDMINATTLEATPTILLNNYNHVGCLCSRCCLDLSNDTAKGIDISGLLPEETETEDGQLLYIDHICWLTFNAIRRFEAEFIKNNRTGVPTTMPSVVPSEAPSEVPTMNPSSKPSQKASDSPSSVPTSSPTAVPTIFPTETPTKLPTNAPASSSPTAITTSPTRAIDVRIELEYTIQLESSTPTSAESVNKLVQAMDQLAEEVASEIVFSDKDANSRHLRDKQQRRRHLEVLVSLPTSLLDGDGNIVTNSIDAIESVDCPAEVSDDTMRCENMTASIGLILDDEQPQAAEQLYKSAMQAAIDGGRFQASLKNVDGDSSIQIVTSNLATTQNPRGESDDDSSNEFPMGAIIGIAVGGVAAIGIVVFLLLQQGRQSSNQERYNDLETEPKDNFLSLQDALEFQRKDEDVDDKVPPSPATTYGKSPAKSYAMSELSDDPRFMQQQGQSALSDAGSVDSGSVYSDLYLQSGDGMEVYPDLATIATAEQRHAPRSPHKQVEIQNLKELETVLENEDWAGVGASVQYIARQDQIMESDLSFSSCSQASSLKNRPWRKKLDPGTVGDLDRLVEDGNWEGVVNAAAKYGEQSVHSETNRDAFSIDSHASYAGSNVTTSMLPVDLSESMANTVNTSVTEATTATQKRKREEIRKEVKELIQRAVPDEVNNVDGMILEFKGREEELVETLRGMREKQIIRRARETTNKIAKLEARATVEALQSSQEDQSKPLESSQAMDNGDEDVFDGIAGKQSESSTQQHEPTAASEVSSMTDVAVIDANATVTTNCNGNVTKTDEQDYAQTATDWAIQQTLAKLYKMEEDNATDNDDDDDDNNNSNHNHNCSYHYHNCSYHNHDDNTEGNHRSNDNKGSRNDDGNRIASDYHGRGNDCDHNNKHDDTDN